MKVGLISLGCPKNQVDAEVMAGLIKKAGHTLTHVEEEAEAIIINTCSFIQEASEESIETILEISELKEKGRLKYLITSGCLAQRYKSGLLKELPEVDAFIGTGEFEKVAEVLDGLSKGDASIKTRRVPAPTSIYSHDTPRVRFTPKHWGYLKISEGCDNRCSYCMIPSLRGRLRSRPADSVVAEAEILAGQGVKEICLIAQDTTAYGKDRKDHITLTTLLKRLDGVDGLEWVRILYAHPRHITDEFVEYISGGGKTVKYIDMPLQHISDEILARMGRGVTAGETRALVDKLRAKVPGLALRTSLLVGFPGETHKQFMELMRFVKETEFDHLGVFGYSDEEGSPSSKMEKKVSDELVAERRDRIMDAQRKISLKKNRARVGEVLDVLVDGPSKESELLLAGRAYFQAPEIDGVVYVTDGEAKPGAFARVKIAEAHEYDLAGKAVEV